MVNEALFVVIVNRGKADEVLQEMQGFGLTGGIVFHGEGTVPNRVLQFLGLDETQKDVIITPIPRVFENPLHEMMLSSFKVNRKNRGIAFSIPLSHYMGEDMIAEGFRYDPERFAYHCIHVIIEKDKSHDLIEAAREAGATGGTIVHAHGAGVPSTESFFDLNIQPEKDLVLILASSKDVSKIRQEIVSAMELEKPGNGILFVLPTTRVSGLYEANRLKEVRA